MSENEGMLAIPDDLLGSIAGGVLDEGTCNSITELTSGWKDNGVPRDTVMEIWQFWAENKADPEDWPQIEGIVNSIYGV